jgi:short-subunit dehydrogenase
MSKSALRGLSESLQSELTGSGVHLLLVHPGGVKTNLIKNAPNLEKDLQEKAHTNFIQMSYLTPDKVAARIIKAVHKKTNRLIIGFDARLILWIRAFFPRKHPKIIATIFSQAKFKDDPIWRSGKR